jgi:hypothetical protein
MWGRGGHGVDGREVGGYEGGGRDDGRALRVAAGVMAEV